MMFFRRERRGYMKIYFFVFLCKRYIGRIKDKRMRWVIYRGWVRKEWKEGRNGNRVVGMGGSDSFLSMFFCIVLIFIIIIMFYILVK